MVETVAQSVSCMKYSRLLFLVVPFAVLPCGCTDDPMADSQLSSSINFGVASDISQESMSRSSSRVVTRMVATGEGADSLWFRMIQTPTATDRPPVSRGVLTDGSSIADFGVSCFRTIGDTRNVYFSGEKYTGSALSDSWQNSQGKIYYWMPSDASFDFYAWTPYGAPVFTDAASGTFRYTVSPEVRNQIDLCGCYVESATPGRKVPLVFGHLLSRILFKVPVRDDLASGTVTGIEISNVCRTGSYSLISGHWTPDSSDRFTYKLKPETDYVSGAELTAGGLQLFLLPQTLTEGTIITISFKDNNGLIKTYTRSLKGVTWLKGYTYTFSIGIADDGSFEFAGDTPILDANYVMHTNVIHPLNIGDTEDWTAVVRTADGADVTIQKEADVNFMATEGFWSDRILDKNGVDKGSARGTDRISSTGTTDVPVRIFLPENVSEQNRIIYVDFYVGSGTQPVTTLTLLQYCPDWVGDYGWEQIDDNGIGNFGFDWTRLVHLTYKYSIGTSANTNNKNYKYADGIRKSYNGYERWTGMGTFRKSVLNYRCYITLDYSMLTDLTGSDSRTDGLQNTRWLNEYGGDAATMAMENGILSIRKTEKDHQHETAFRIANSKDDGTNAPESRLTTPKLASDIALSHALMKNPYNLRETEANEDGEMGYIPVIKEIKWYLPALGQFSILPKLEPINPGEYWSSTIDPGKTTKPYDGSGSQRGRNEWLKIRACRNRY